MKQSIFFRTDASILCLILFVGCIIMVILGRFLRVNFLSKDEQESKGGVNSLLGALFGLWGFILAFTFGNSATRFENVRSMMVEESNLIRTGILRVETFPDSLRYALRCDLKDYLEARINYYELSGDADKFNQSKTEAENIGRRLWSNVVNISARPNMGIPSNNMLATLTTMFDVASRRDALLQSGTPEMIVYMLFFLAAVISFIGGFTTPVIKTKEWIVISGFVLLACIIIFITLDLGRPMRGFIRPDVGQEKIVNLRRFFN